MREVGLISQVEELRDILLLLEARLNAVLQRCIIRSGKPFEIEMDPFNVSCAEFELSLTLRRKRPVELIKNQRRLAFVLQATALDDLAGGLRKLIKDRSSEIDRCFTDTPGNRQSRIAEVEVAVVANNEERADMNVELRRSECSRPSFRVLRTAPALQSGKLRKLKRRGS